MSNVLLPETSFKSNERVELPCVASGDPPPSYSWKKDGQPLVISGIDIRQLPGVGTIQIEEPTAETHEGVYQCFAKNEFGTAISIKTTLKKAVQEPFPSIKEPKVHKPVVGQSLTLRCQPPYGYPKGSIYWVDSKQGSKLNPIIENDRVSLDYEGNLHFSNIEMGDHRQGLHYTCIVQNPLLRSLMQGDDQKIEPKPATPKYMKPSVMWTSRAKEVAIKGQTKKLKCIFAGFPTPRVTWTRLDTPLLETGHIQRNSDGQEIIISNVDFSDEGTYECSAVNTDSGHPKATHKTQLVVESAPYWKNDQPPEDVNTSEEESAQFSCEASGVPNPTISWYINGVPLNEVPSSRRRIVANDYRYIRYENVTKTDAQVLQCNASNEHGFIFANAYLNVLAEPPSFINTMQSVTKVAEGQTVVLTCQVFGAPKPIITWKKGNESLIMGGRFKKESSGNLQITGVIMEDDGRYSCSAENKFGHEEVDGLLIVRQKTTILNPPVNKTVDVLTDVTLRCNATTDPLERSKLKISWLYNGEKIEFGSETNVARYNLDDSLKITQAQIDNTGSYTCNASTELDWQAVTVQLTVKGRPDPPYDVRMVSCSTLKAEVAWIPGSDNNDPIIEYIIYYNTSFDEPDTFREGTRTSSNKQLAQVRLQPWTNYTFSVRARNSLGLSERSLFTPAFCTTPQQKPYRNPKNVCTVNRGAHELAIVWQRMNRTEHNGEGFHYIVSYKRNNDDGAEEFKVNVTDWQREELIISNQELYKEYEISVQAANSEGLAPQTSIERKIGYSGQDVPLDQPKNFNVDKSTINSTSADFVWDPVDTSVERIRGFFIGYQLIFWKTGNRSTSRTLDIRMHSWEPCRPLTFHPTRLRRRRSHPVRRHINNLWPYSNITAGVLVLNAGHPGALSDTVEFQTLEGVPSAVTEFRVIEKGSNHLKLSWNMPYEHNGILKSYVIEYKEAPPAMGPAKPLIIENIYELQKKLSDLEPDTPYIVYIWAATGVGRGEEMFLEARTNVLAAPSIPAISSWDTGDNSVNVSWTPTTDDSYDNPGHKFVIEYRKKDGSDDDWTSVGPEDEHNWLNVSNLEPGTAYEFRVVAMNNGDNKTASLPTVIYIGPQPAPVEQNIAGASWFIALMCIAAFLLLILLLLCLIKRNRGGKYAVHEKEKLRGHDSLHDDDEAGFGEYTRTEEPDPHKKSRESLNSEEKPLESETDSLGEYEDPDPSKFNEDGSFIGQYGGKKKSSERVDQDGTTPSALSTFV